MDSNNSDQKTPRPNGGLPKMSLDAAQEYLRLQVSQYRPLRHHQLIGLTRICHAVRIVKLAFVETPKEKRPVRSWTKFAPQEMRESRLDLDCKTVRMADNYAKLGEDLGKVDQAEVRKRVSEGSYREVRKVVNILLNKTSPTTSLRAEKLLAQAGQAVSKAIRATEGHFLNLDITDKLKRASEAYALRNKDVVPELTAMSSLGLPDQVRHSINIAVRMSDDSPSVAGLHAFERGSYCAFGDSGVAFELWTTGGAVDEARLSHDRQSLFANWLQMRQILHSALGHKIAGGAKH